MKLAIKLLCFMLLVGFALPLHANGEPILSVKTRTSEKCLVQLKGMKNENFQISLIDQSGTVLQKEKVEYQDVYKKMYNLKNLPVGIYTLSIESERQIILQPISIRTKGILIDPLKERTILKPHFIYNYPFVDMNAIYFEEDAMQITIRDLENVVLHSSISNKKGSICKRFDVKSLPEGEYLVKVVTAFYTYEYPMEVTKTEKRKTEFLTPIAKANY